MAVSRTGTYVTFTSASGSGSQGITVPADTEIMLAFISGWDSGNYWLQAGATLTIDGDALTFIDNTVVGGGNEHIGAYYRVNPSTGSQTFAWDWGASGEPTDGAHFVFVFYKGVDTGDPIRDFATNDSGEDVTGLTANAGDMIVGGVTEYTPSTVTSTDDDGQTEIYLSALYRSSAIGIGEEADEGDFYATVPGTAPSAVAAVLRAASGGTAQALEGSVEASATIAAALEVERQLAGTIDAVATIDAAIAVSRELEGATSASATVAAALEVLRELAGTIEAAGDTSGVLQVVRYLAGAITAEAALAADLDVPEVIELAGAITAAAQADGALTVERLLSGAVTAAADLSAELSTARTLAGAIAAQAAVAGDLSVLKYMQGVLQASGNVAAAIQVERLLSGTLSAEATVAAALAVGAAFAEVETGVSRLTFEESGTSRLTFEETGVSPL